MIPVLPTVIDSAKFPEVAFTVPRNVAFPVFASIATASFQMPVIGSLNPIAIPLAVMPMAD